jgi:hypothetical protein
VLKLYYCGALCGFIAANESSTAKTKDKYWRDVAEEIIARVLLGESESSKIF